MAGNTVLSYHDSCLTTEDVKLLERGRWINDKIIAFWFEYLEHTALASCQHVALVTPDVTQMIKFMSADELGMVLEPLQLPSRSLVLFAVNNNSSHSVAGGQHWSLLAYRRDGNSFEHHDSMDQSNASEARQLERKLAAVLKCNTIPTHVNVQSPRQPNSSDCGMYVIYYAERFVLDHIQLCVTDDGAAASGTCYPSVSDALAAGRVDFPLAVEIIEKRKEVRACIDRLAQEDAAAVV